MSTSARRTFVAIRPRGARSGDAGHPLPVAPRSRPCLAAGRLSARGRPCPEIGEFWICGSTQSTRGEVSAGAEGGAQRSNEVHEQGDHPVIVHDGKPWRPDTLSLIATVGKHASWTASWRRTGACAGKSPTPYSGD